jgi:murein DD-endopeptidase MepM/ murein hydrolase activator NlpD
MYELKDDDGVILQALIPIGEIMQIHLTKDYASGKYHFDIIPVEYEIKEYYAKVIIDTDFYADTFNTIRNKKVARRLKYALEGIVDDQTLQQGDEIDFVYEQSTRMGKPYLVPKIKVAKVTTGGKEKIIYVDDEGDGFANTDKKVAYTITGKKKVTYSKKVPVSKAETRFGMPLRHTRITSSFSYSRYHPILHRYRPHHGTDFGARRGTPLLAVNSGRVSFSGWMGGYGKVVKINHGSGYESLYAHQSRRNVKVGERVRKGQVIGYVGSTGKSTGPHLHFGLKKDGRWINPMNVLGKKSLNRLVLKKFVKYEDVTTTRFKTVAIKGVKEKKSKLLRYINLNTPSYVWDEDE